MASHALVLAGHEFCGTAHVAALELQGVSGALQVREDAVLCAGGVAATVLETRDGRPAGAAAEVAVRPVRAERGFVELAAALFHAVRVGLALRSWVLVRGLWHEGVDEGALAGRGAAVRWHRRGAAVFALNPAGRASATGAAVPSARCGIVAAARGLVRAAVVVTATHRDDSARERHDRDAEFPSLHSKTPGTAVRELVRADQGRVSDHLPREPPARPAPTAFSSRMSRGLLVDPEDTTRTVSAI